jgi:hypothetical protein
VVLCGEKHNLLNMFSGFTIKAEDGGGLDTQIVVKLIEMPQINLQQCYNRTNVCKLEGKQ